MKDQVFPTCLYTISNSLFTFSGIFRDKDLVVIVYKITNYSPMVKFFDAIYSDIIKFVPNYTVICICQSK